MIKLPVGRVTRLLIKAFEKREKEKVEKSAWDMWISLYPDMVLPHPLAKKPRLEFIPFSQFLDRVTNPEKAKKEAKSKESVKDTYLRFKMRIQRK